MTREVPIAANSVSPVEAPMTRADIVAFFERRREAYDDLDAAALTADYTEDCVLVSPMTGTQTGRAAVEQAFRRFFNAFLDMKIHVESQLIDGSRAAQVLVVEGTDLGGFMGVPPSGRTVRLHALFGYEFRNGRIAREQRIYDFTGLLVQVGVLKAKQA